LYSNGTITDLNAFACYGPANAINSAGQIVGGDSGHPFLYTGGQVTNLITDNWLSGAAYGINDAGQVVGGIKVFGAIAHACLYDGHGGWTDLGTLGGTDTYAHAINNAGQIIGGSISGEYSDDRAFIYSKGTMTDLGFLPGGYQSHANGINSAGDVVGDACTGGDSEPHAFLYRNGTMIDLNGLIDPASGWTLEYAGAINDGGQIACSGYVSSEPFWLYSEEHNLLLTPIPEPATLSLVGLGLAGLVMRRQRK
jgi:probable HAF family extracellular repeat protein